MLLVFARRGGSQDTDVLVRPRAAEPLEEGSARPTPETASRDHGLKKPSSGRQPFLPLTALRIPTPSAATGARSSCPPYGGCGHPQVAPGRLKLPAGLSPASPSQTYGRISALPAPRGPEAALLPPSPPPRLSNRAGEPDPGDERSTRAAFSRDYGGQERPGGGTASALPPAHRSPRPEPQPSRQARRGDRRFPSCPRKLAQKSPQRNKRTSGSGGLGGPGARPPRGRAGKAHAAASRRAGAARRGRGQELRPERRSRLSANCRQPVTALRAAAGARLRQHRAGRRRGGVRGGGAPFIFGRAAESGPGRGAPGCRRSRPRRALLTLLFTSTALHSRYRRV